MSCQQKIKQKIQESINLKEQLLADDNLLNGLETLTEWCLDALWQGGKVIFAGNGGSFADAQHLAAEFVSSFMFDRAPLPGLALGTNNSCMSATGNDYGYDQVFARELRAHGLPQDVFIPITTSGNSPNILAAVEVAKQIDLRVLGWTGHTGGKLIDRCECLRVPSNETARIQECHILLGHILCELVEKGYFADQR